MGYSIYDRGGRNTEPYVATLTVDDLPDLDNLDLTDYNPGTSVLVISTGSVYMLNSEKVLVPLGG